MLLCLQSDDEEAAKEEEAEALRLQRKEAEALLPEYFEQPSEPESEEDAEGAEAEAGTLGAAAARVGFTHAVCYPSQKWQFAAQRSDGVHPCGIGTM